MKVFFLLTGIFLLALSINAKPLSNVINAKKLVIALKHSTPYCENSDEHKIVGKSIEIQREWQNNVCHSTIVNNGTRPVRISNIVLFEISKSTLLDSNSHIYGEGFQMLSQLEGTLAHPRNVTGYSDQSHYRIIGPHHMTTAYGLFSLTMARGDYMVLGFSSCKKFIGRIAFSAKKIIVSVDPENLLLKAGQRVSLEDFMALDGKDKNKLLDQLAGQIIKTHPPIFKSPIPVGWSSWYCYGSDFTQNDIIENLKGFAKTLPSLKYIQIDDGFQPFMGDWLVPNPKYGSLPNTLSAIKKEGFTPAIWLAPFIAEKNSALFKNHPDWFVKDSCGAPLVSSKVGFGGWHNGPWYVLDGTNPHAQAYLRDVIKTMREKWGVEYFKLDANYWGAIHGGIHYDSTATRIEAYREGMKAILSACGSNTVILGCNQPNWPSFGLITAARTSNDVSRDWTSFASTARENLLRSWQNGKLWYCDPDGLLLGPNGNSGKEIKPNEYLFHATVLHAIGGLMMLGDKYRNLSAKQFEIINKEIPPTGKSARFTDDSFQTGVTDLGAVQYYYFLNWNDKETISLKMKLKGRASLENYWEGAGLGVHEGVYEVKNLPPHSAVIIKATLIQS
ncbi:glycoside hydrolase family 36 protein [Arachidicoccus sp.]|uniref:glycoside hydrolase family 36 protein n=1 Tax=Arachidicoccus sp. TaxID=1872624 RepID=UPI003D22063F